MSTQTNEQLIEEAVQRFDKTFSSDDLHVSGRDKWLNFLIQELSTIASKSGEETARYCISISEMTDEQMEHLEEKYNFTLTEPPVPQFITQHAGRVMKNGKWVLEEKLKEHPVFGDGIEIQVMDPIDPICKKHNYRLMPQDAECSICWHLRNEALSKKEQS